MYLVQVQWFSYVFQCLGPHTYLIYSAVSDDISADTETKCVDLLLRVYVSDQKDAMSGTGVSVYTMIRGVKYLCLLSSFRLHTPCYMSSYEDGTEKCGRENRIGYEVAN
jgi:hypothetical protein